MLCEYETCICSKNVHKSCIRTYVYDLFDHVCLSVRQFICVSVSKSECNKNMLTSENEGCVFAGFSCKDESA